MNKKDLTKDDCLREIKRLVDVSAYGMEVISQMFDLFEQQIRAECKKEFDIMHEQVLNDLAKIEDDNIEKARADQREKDEKERLKETFENIPNCKLHPNSKLLLCKECVWEHNKIEKQKIISLTEKIWKDKFFMYKKSLISSIEKEIEKLHQGWMSKSMKDKYVNIPEQLWIDLQDLLKRILESG